jgi:hypothetical protein
MGVGHRSKSFKSSAEVLQFGALTNATHEGFPIDRDDGLKQANGRLGQETEGLFRCRKQPLEFCDGGLSRLMLDPEGLVDRRSGRIWSDVPAADLATQR